MEPLSPDAIRVLGALMEKSMTTPEYYPLTLNALVAACNQKSNRDPVVHYDPDEVEMAHEALRGRRLGHKIFSSDSRVAKFNQTARETLGLDQPQAALLCVLLLRGAQTPGELRQRTARMHEFEDLGAIDDAMDSLMRKEPGPLAVKLSRRGGAREARYMHLLGGPVEAAEQSPPASPAPGRMDELEAEIADLRGRVEKLEDVLRDLTE